MISFRKFFFFFFFNFFIWSAFYVFILFFNSRIYFIFLIFLLYNIVLVLPYINMNQVLTERLPFQFSLPTFMHWRRKWQPTPVFLPGESQGRGSWWAAVYGVAQSRTWLKWLSSSSSKFKTLPSLVLRLQNISEGLASLNKFPITPFSLSPY